MEVGCDAAEYAIIWGVWGVYDLCLAERPVWIEGNLMERFSQQLFGERLGSKVGSCQSFSCEDLRVGFAKQHAVFDDWLR